MTLTRFGGHLILAVRPEEGALDGASVEVPPEFRREAVELVKTSDRSRVEIARSLGISDNTLANWVAATGNRSE